VFGTRWRALSTTDGGRGPLAFGWGFTRKRAVKNLLRDVARLERKDDWRKHSHMIEVTR
jgi:hypothetical protein